MLLYTYKEETGGGGAILPTLSLLSFMLIVPNEIHLHNGTTKKRLSVLILLMQLDYCLCAYNN